MRGDVLGKFGEPEIGNFGLGVVDEDVGDFEVAMDDVFFGQVEQPLEDIFDDGGSFVLVEVALLSESGFEVPLVAEFGDDVAVAVAGEDLEAFEDIGVAQLLEDVDFREKKLLKFFAFEGLELDDLDGYDFA